MSQLSTRAGLALTVLTVVGLLGSSWISPASAQVETVTARVVVQAISADVLELCVDLGEPPERLCPRQRRFPHAAAPLGSWLRSERVYIGPESSIRIRARRIQTNRIEFNLELETGDERRLLQPDRRYLTPSRLAVGRWAVSSPIDLVLLTPSVALPAVPGQGVPDNAPALELGKRATNFSLPNLRNERQLVEFTNFRSRTRNAVTVIIFWSSWSPNDAETLQALNQIQREQDNVRVLGINVYEDPEPALALLDELGIEFVNVRDATGGVAAHYRIGGLPELYFVDEGGVYRETIQGAAPTESIQAAIDRAAVAP